MTACLATARIVTKIECRLESLERLKLNSAGEKKISDPLNMLRRQSLFFRKIDKFGMSTAERPRTAPSPDCCARNVQGFAICDRDNTRPSKLTAVTESAACSLKISKEAVMQLLIY
jgi:hypothetical protein